MAIGFTKFWKSFAAALVLGFGCQSLTRAATGTSGQELVRSYCSGCHQEHAGQFGRISAIRKTPEGWVMTLFRMRQMHGLVLADDVRESIVRYLADTQGLAPAESAAGRFALERQPNAKDLDLGPEMGAMCGRCHSLARVSLQRRDEGEWRKLSHTHLGQWPSLEFQESARDRPWWHIASGPLPRKLAALFPLSTAAWNDWKARPARDLSGSWVVVGRVPGGKNFYGTARIDRRPGGDYTAGYQLTDVGGFAFNGNSKAIVYTGYEWRGSAEVGDRSLREVFAVSEDGNRIAGRWFDADHADDGGEWTAVRAEGRAEVLAVFPQSLRAGSTATVTIVGDGLDAKAAPPLSFGDGIVVANVQREPHRIRALVTVGSGEAPGLRQASIGGAVANAGAVATLAVYTQIDHIDVVPAYAIARVGGGRVAPVTAQFEAMAATRLPGGEMLSLGPVMAEWTSIPFNAEAKRAEDEKFAGHFDPRGRFLPNSAGPNLARQFSGNNVGNLTVLARVEDGSRSVEGRGHLVVTVQRWNTPPIY